MFIVLSLAQQKAKRNAWNMGNVCGEVAQRWRNIIQSVEVGKVVLFYACFL